MKRMLLLAVLVMLLVPCAHAENERLCSFEELKQALFNGEEVRAVIHYGRCTMTVDGKEAPAPDAVGGLPIEVFEYFAPGSVKNDQAYLVFSAGTYINFRGYKYNYVKFKVFEDNRVEVTAQYAKPVTFRVLMDETFTTTIANGRNQGALMLFRD